MTAALELRQISKSFGATKAIDNISLTISKGEIVALLGPSGCGKTTTLRLIAGFEAPDTGELHISGMNMQGRRPFERSVGLLFQDYALFPHMTVGENVAYGLRRRGIPRNEITSLTKRWLRVVKLHEHEYEMRRPAELSGGQQQRVALARALAINPDIILLDEPLSALDAKLRQEIRVELKEILISVGATTIIVTHDQEEAMSLSQRIVIMDRGHIIQEGSPREIYDNPKTRFVAEFVGQSNWFLGSLGAQISSTVKELIAPTGLRLLVPNVMGSVGERYEVCVRPERISVDEMQAGPSSGIGTLTNILRGKIRDLAHLGSDLHFLVDVGLESPVIVIKHYLGQRPLQEGDLVRIQFRPEDCIMLPAGTAVGRNNFVRGLPPSGADSQTRDGL